MRCVRMDMYSADPHVTVPFNPVTQGGMQEDVLIWLAHALDSTVHTALMPLHMPFDDHTGTECRTEPETYHWHTGHTKWPKH
jgi:hypothetical protein